jgi:NAD(P)-dependent dehydrogenase (short-subunit alcohol dehydrogenase family)
MRRSGGGRVVNLSSRAHMRWDAPIDPAVLATAQGEIYEGMTIYGRSKLCNIYFSTHLAKKFPFAESKITFNALHPGLVDTKLLNTIPGFKSQAIPVSDGCRCSVYVATSPEIEGVTGEYFHDSAVATNPSFISSVAKSETEAAKVWELSLKLVGIRDEDYGSN